MSGELGAVVLAGGRSRHSGTEKAKTTLGGRTVLERVLEVVCPFVDDVAIVGPWAPDGFTVSPEAWRYDGPLAGMSWGMSKVGTEYTLLIGCDHPLLEPQLLGRLLVRRRAATVVVAEGPHGPEPLVGVYHERCATLAAELADIGERRLHALLDRTDVSLLSRSDWADVDPDGRSFLDVEWPDDFETIENLVG